MNVEYFYPYEAEDVANLLMDPDFLVERSEYVGEKNASCEVSEHGNKTVVKLHVERELELPSFLKKMFHPYQVIDIVEEWQKIGPNYIGNAVYHVEDQPVTISTEIIVKETAEGSSIFCAVKAKASVPLVAGKVEKFIVEHFIEGGNKAFGYINTYMEK